jgi:hypothetical protein
MQNHMSLCVICLGVNCMAQASSGAATCPAASAPAAQPGAAPGPSRVMRPQLPLSDPGQLRGRHVSYGLSSRCPARYNFGVTTCALEAQRSMCYLSNRYPLSVTIMITLRGVCASSAPHDKTCGQGRLQGYSSAAPTHCPYTVDRCSAGRPDGSVSGGACVPRRPAARS